MEEEEKEKEEEEKEEEVEEEVEEEEGKKEEVEGRLGEAGLWRWGRMDGNLRRGEFPLPSNPRAFQLDRHSIMEQLSVSDWCNSSEMISDKIWPSRISINLHMTLTNLYQRYI